MNLWDKLFYKEKFSKSEFIRKYNKTDLTDHKTRQIMEMSDAFLDKINSGYNLQLENESLQAPYSSEEPERTKRLVK